MAISLTHPNKSSNFSSFNFDPPALQNERLSTPRTENGTYRLIFLVTLTWGQAFDVKFHIHFVRYSQILPESGQVIMQDVEAFTDQKASQEGRRSFKGRYDTTTG
jgi:hypothetical protein